MKSLGHFLNEAKATYCGRCDTTHVAPSKGGTCPALKEGSDDSDDVPFKGPYRKAGDRKDEYGNKIKNVAKHLAKKAMKTMTPKTEETKMKTLSQFIEEASLNEAHDVELKPHENGTHYIVHKIHPKSGIEKDQLKVGEKLSDTHVDDLHDMGYKVKIHSS